MSPERLLLALLALLLYALLCLAVQGQRRRRRQRAAEAAAALLPAAPGCVPLLVLHASQTGQAEALAWQTARSLHTAGVPVRLAALGEISDAELRAAQRALIVASTYGEGDAPDGAAAFARRLTATHGGPDLQGLHWGLLALGDSSYRHFCGFGRALGQGLRQRGAQPLFEAIEVDRGNAEALSCWRQQLSHLAGTRDLPDWDAPAFQPWRLAARRLLNAGSPGEPLYLIELLPADGQALPQALPDWQAGDLVQLQPEADPRQAREYSIASLPASGSLQLLVRLARRADGSAGLASGLLCLQARPGDRLALRLRSHSGFRIGANAVRPLILIGNGSGMAGLRAHLMARAAAPLAPAWLIFGERSAASDAHCRAEIEAWQQQGWLRHADWVFSRAARATPSSAPRYVQHVLAARAERLREWVRERGAAIYVCGSLQGMAGGVETVLRETLGTQQVDALIAQGRYRRDVY